MFPLSLSKSILLIHFARSSDNNYLPYFLLSTVGYYDSGMQIHQHGFKNRLKIDKCKIQKQFIDQKDYLLLYSVKPVWGIRTPKTKETGTTSCLTHHLLRICEKTPSWSCMYVRRSKEATEEKPVIFNAIRTLELVESVKIRPCLTVLFNSKPKVVQPIHPGST